MSSTISQLSCFSSINRKFYLQKRSINIVTSNLPSKLTVVMNFKESGTEIPTSETKSTLSYTGASNPHVQGATKSYSNSEEQIDGKLGMGEPVHEGSTQQKKGAKIHDFCFGIPYGGIVLSGGLVGFLFSRNLTTLSTGVLFGGALLALSTFSLKVWRQGKSSLPFIVGQAVLSAALLGKHIQTYSLTKKVFPTGFYAIISAAMLCFYSYVLISGGNPPPKKKTVQTATS